MIKTNETPTGTEYYLNETYLCTEDDDLGMIAIEEFNNGECTEEELLDFFNGR